MRLGEKLLDRLRQKMCGGMADDIQAFCVFIGHDGEIGIVLDFERRVDQLAVHPTRQCRARQSSANRRRHFGDRHRVIEHAFRAIGQANDGHKQSLEFRV